MNNSEKNLGEPSFENDKLRFWKVEPEKEVGISQPILEVKDGERMFEARVYPIEELAYYLKILSKQNLKTGEIYAVVVKQEGEVKQVLGRRVFRDENDYSKVIKTFELNLGTTFKINPKKVRIITAKEFEETLKKAQ